MEFTGNDLLYFKELGYTKTPGMERFTKNVGDKTISVLPYPPDMLSYDKDQRLWAAVLNKNGEIINEGEYLSNGIFLKDFESRLSQS